MDFYVTRQNGQRLHFPMNPESITTQTGSRMVTFDLIREEVRIPTGRKPELISWEARFPGSASRNMPYVKSWRDPKELLDIIYNIRDNREKVRLMVTETTINMDVYIEGFDPTWKGGGGDCFYRIDFVQARELKVYTDAEWAGISSAAASSAASIVRTAPPPPKTYTVKSGDTLYGIAKTLLENGNRWREIYEDPANRQLIGPNPDLIYPGQELRIPSGEGSSVA